MKRAFLVLLLVTVFGCAPAPPSSSAAITTPLAVATSTETALARPSTASSAIACSQPISTLAPPLVFQNGNLDLGSPFHLGAVRFFLAGCRDIDTIRARYGLGPASLVITEPGGGDIRTRYYRAGVVPGEEAVTITRLASHPEDFQYVEFDFVSIGCAIGCVTSSSVTPREGPVGTSFSMRLCCWDAGARVTKTFTTPNAKTIVLTDVAGEDRTVPAGWGGSNTDERGTYSVFVRDDRVGTLVRFRVT